MNTQPEATVTIDYVKFIIPLDPDRLQQLAGNINAYETANTAGFKWGRTASLAVWDSTPATSGRRRLVIDAWAEGAATLINLLNPTYLEYVTRLDYRRTLPGVDTKMIEAFVMRQSMSKKGRRNVQTFRSAPRRKNNKRDVGGHGVYFGSRKSDSHTAAYQRGDETPAIEHRFQGRKAADIACEALAEWYNASEPGETTALLLPVLERYARQELVTATGYTDWGRLAGAMELDKRHIEQLNQASGWLETRAEAEYWAGLPEDEQYAMQTARYVPTRALGLEPAQLPPPEPTDAELDMWIEDHNATTNNPVRKLTTQEILDMYNSPEDDGA